MQWGQRRLRTRRSSAVAAARYGSLSARPSATVSRLGVAGMAELLYTTGGGQAWLGDAAQALRDVCEPDSVDLIMTSPPFALLNQKDYGNESQDDYVRWFQPFADEFWRVL